MSATLVQEQPPEQTTSPELTYRAILRLYVPLALSWVFMALEGPSTTAIIGHRPNRELNSAAQLVLMSLALWIESPVIDLLSTSTTLAKNRQHFVKLSRYVLYLVIWVTVVHALVVLTPLYDVVTLRILTLPPKVAAQAHLPLIFMIPWSGFIGWRRYLQGVLIRYHLTRLISVGTFMRIITISAIGWSLFFFTDLEGIVIAGIALVSAVAAEALFVFFASRSIIRREFGQAAPPDGDPATEGSAPYEGAESAVAPDTEIAPTDGNGDLTYSRLLKFHLPLTATTMVALIGNPIISKALASSPAPVLSLASWQIVTTLVWLSRTIEFALPEVIITLYKNAASAAKLRRFSFRVGIVIAGSMALMALTGGDKFFFGQVLGEPQSTVQMAHMAFVFTITLPLIGSQQNYVKGMLTAHHLTTARFMSSIVSFSTLVLMLVIGVFMRWPGVINAAVALNVSLLAEVSVLTVFWQRGKKKSGFLLA